MLQASLDFTAGLHLLHALQQLHSTEVLSGRWQDAGAALEYGWQEDGARAAGASQDLTAEIAEFRGLELLLFNAFGCRLPRYGMLEPRRGRASPRKL